MEICVVLVAVVIFVVARAPVDVIDYAIKQAFRGYDITRLSSTTAVQLNMENVFH